MKNFNLVLAVVVLGVVGMCSLSKADMGAMMQKDGMMAKDNLKTEPALGGFCPTCLIHGLRNMGSAQYTSVYEGKTYMFTSAETKKFFDENPAVHAKEAQMKYDEMVKDTMPMKDNMNKDSMMNK